MSIHYLSLDFLLANSQDQFVAHHFLRGDVYKRQHLFYLVDKIFLAQLSHFFVIIPNLS